jgi:hypothetical protein
MIYADEVPDQAWPGSKSFADSHKPQYVILRVQTTSTKSVSWGKHWMLHMHLSVGCSPSFGMLIAAVPLSSFFDDVGN